MFSYNSGEYTLRTAAMQEDISGVYQGGKALTELAGDDDGVMTTDGNGLWAHRFDGDTQVFSTPQVPPPRITPPCAPLCKMPNNFQRKLRGGVDNPSAFLYNNTCILAAATMERCPSGLWNWS